MCYSGEVPRGVRADGIICRHSGERRIIDAAYNHQVPVVSFEHDQRCDWPRVYYDEEAIGSAGAQHLLDRGYQTLCFFHLRLSTSQLQRMVGFRQTVEAAGCEFIELAPEVPSPMWNPPPGEWWRWLKEKLDQLEMPIGVMITNDQLARPFIEAVSSMGRHVPAEIATVSAENDPLLCEVGQPAISSVETNTRQMGYEAARLLDRLIDGKAAPAKTITVSPKGVVARSSTNVRALHNIHAAKALHYIWENYRQPITVNDVADTTPLTRRRLQTLFYESVGRTMREELSRIRLIEACYLLKNSELQIGEIARRTGFGNGSQMHRSFVVAYDQSPRDFQRQGKMPDESFMLPLANHFGHLL